MKKIFLLSLLIVLLPLVVASNLNVQVNEVEPVVIVDIDRPATFLFTLQNLGSADNFLIYSLASVSMQPNKFFSISSGGKEVIEVSVYPNDVTKKFRGDFFFNYQIKGINSGFYDSKLKIRLVELKDAFDIKVESITPSDEFAKVSITNKEKYNFNEVKLIIKSPFFETEELVNLGRLETKNFEIKIDEEKAKKVRAGTYNADVSVSTEGANAKVSGVEIKYLEKEGVSVSTSSEGFIIKERTITKTNEGSVPVTVQVDMRRDVLTRLFTSYSVKPTSSERRGLFVYYNWENRINPSESFVVVSTTNYTLPFVIVLLVICVALLVKFFSGKDLTLEKRVSYVKTKGGEFALRVRLNVRAKKDMEHVQIIDKLPHMVKIFEQFQVKPDRIDEKTRRIFWSIPKINAGEHRVFSYVIYSKINVVGKFELPPATATYKDGENIKEFYSNKAYFVSGSAENNLDQS